MGERIAQWVAQHTFASSGVSPIGVGYRRNCRVKLDTTVGHVACRLVLSPGMSCTRIGILVDITAGHVMNWLVLSSGMSRTGGLYRRECHKPVDIYRRWYHDTFNPIVGDVTILLILSSGMSRLGCHYRRVYHELVDTYRRICYDPVDPIVGHVTIQLSISLGMSRYI